MIAAAARASLGKGYAEAAEDLNAVVGGVGPLASEVVRSGAREYVE